MTASAPADAPRRSLPRWVWLVLIASLAANLFVVGVVARTVWPSRYASASNGPGGLFGNLLAYSKSLPEGRRAIVRQGLPGDRPMQSLRPLREELRSARAEAVRLFKAEPFDRTAFLTAEARVQAAEAGLRQAVVRFATDIADRMTAGERAAFLKWRDLHRPGQGRGSFQAERDNGAAAPPNRPAVK